MNQNPITRVRVAIVGGGPAGIGAAVGLAKRRIGPILLLDRWDKPGGVPAKYPAKAGSMPTYVAATQGKVLFGQQFVDGLLKKLPPAGLQWSLETLVIHLDTHRRQLTVVNPRQGKHLIQADAIVLATGAREQTGPEQGWIAGSRNMPALQTMQLLELLNQGAKLPWENGIVAGSDLIAFAAAAKLKGAGTHAVGMVDTAARPQTSWLARRYFRHWVWPRWHQCSTAQYKTASGEKARLELQGGTHIPCDALVVCGRLVPNAELLVAAGIATRPPSHVPVTRSRGRLSSTGFFAAGNLLGGFHGGQWCYFNGLRVARRVASYLQASVQS